MKISCKQLASTLLLFFLFNASFDRSHGQFEGGLGTTTTTTGTGRLKAPAPPAVPAEMESCDGVFLTYTLTSREKEFPHVKNVSKQAWAFKAVATLMNVGDEEVQGWQMYIGFQHKEILVTADGAVPIDAGDFPAEVGNGTTLAGNAMTDLKTAILTANDYDQMRVKVMISGTQFGGGAGATPMPKTIKLVNDGFKCPGSSRRGSRMFVCCKKDPLARAKALKKTKFLPRRKGDLTISYDVLQAFKTNYYVEVTIDNNHPLGRLDHWNLTWEWKSGEFIYSMKGAFPRVKDVSECLYGPAGRYYRDLDFTQVANCAKNPIISDLPAEKKEDEKVGKLPWCCRNGTVLPPIMDRNQARSMFQMQVFKTPPDDDNRTAITPPTKWKIDGVINPRYKCGPPIRVAPKEYPDPTGLKAIVTAVSSWQVVCNITKPKPQQSRCCVSFSAFYNDSAIPCNTCACGGCDGARKCNPRAPPMLLPPDALLVPFENRTAKIKAWAKMKKQGVPSQLPCGDNCPVSINWHVSSDHKDGWTARITLFNWAEYDFQDWFTALQFERSFEDFDNVYSFNGTRIPGIKTVFFQGVKGLNYLVGEVNGTRKGDPRVPGKQQSVITFKKKHVKGFKIGRDGFPTKVFFNGEECSLPPRRPTGAAPAQRSAGVLAAALVALLTFMAF